MRKSGRETDIGGGSDLKIKELEPQEAEVQGCQKSGWRTERMKIAG
jgi:hypothetical protein